MKLPGHVIDLSHPIQQGMPVYPGDEAITLYRSRQLQQDGYTNHRLTTGMHVGTHLDMPMHMIEDGRYVRDLPLERTMGPALVLDVRHETEIQWSDEYAERMCTVVVLWTGWDAFYGSKKYYSHPTVSLEFAEQAWQAGMRLLVMDIPGPDTPPFPVHHFLFDHDVLIVENATHLDRLQSLRQPAVAAVPLNIQADASPVRALAWDLAEPAI